MPRGASSGWRPRLCALVLVWSALAGGADASRGDRSAVFQTCLRQCQLQNCTAAAAAHGGWLWSCVDECKYGCMWRAVEYFQRAGERVPQFYGKWPFARLWCVQEPASAAFSLANLAAHGRMLRTFLAQVPRDAPFYRLWIVYALVCMNAWLWSTVFHTKDSDLTEKADYFCAFSMVLYSAYAAAIRLWGAGRRRLRLALTLACGALFTHHVAYLSLVDFDYGYNMRINILVGAVGAALWLWWCWRRRRRRHVWRCAAVVLAAALALLLETADFAPLLWTLDAHALWHLSTSPLPLLWYRFLIDDCLDQLSREKLA